MKEWKDDKALFALIKEELYTAVVGDIMDKMGYTHQFLPPQISGRCATICGLPVAR